MPGKEFGRNVDGDAQPITVSWISPEFLPRHHFFMRIAKPLLLVMTPIGVGWGLVEAWRFHWWLALLMAALVGIISLFTWFTVRRIRADRAHGP